MTISIAGDLSVLNVILHSLMAFGNIGIVIFMMISGFFMINSKPSLHKALLLALETVFFTIVLYGVSIGIGAVQFSWKELIKRLFPFFYEKSLFIGAYLLIYFFLRLHHKFLNSLNYKQFCLFVGMMALL